MENAGPLSTYWSQSRDDLPAALAPSYPLLVAGIVVLYITSAEWAKRWFYGRVLS